MEHTNLTGEWTDRAACLAYDPEHWFPRFEHQAGAARAVCFECPVIKECDRAAHTIPKHSRYGVWAGIYHSPDRT